MKPVANFEMHLERSRPRLARAIFLFLFSCLFGFLHLQGQSSGMRFYHLTNDNGLSQSVVLSLLQDQKGFIWAGTQHGLNRFDGYNFRVFRREVSDGGSLKDDHITALCNGGRGELWVGTKGGGVSRYIYDTESFVHYQHDPSEPSSLANNEIYDIYKDRKGNIWIGTNGGGLDRWDPAANSFIHYKHQPGNAHSLGNDRVNAIYEDLEGKLWAGTYDGLNVLDRETGAFTRIKKIPGQPNSLSDNIIHCIYQDQRGTLWIGTETGGLNRYEPNTRVFTHFKHEAGTPNSLSNNWVISIFEDSRGVLWIGTDQGGLNRYDPANQRFYNYRSNSKDPYSLTDDRVTVFCEDRGGLLWIGTWDGLNIYNRAQEQFLHYKHNPDNPNSLSDNDVCFIYEDKQENMWLGTSGGGLNLFDRKTKRFTHFRHDPGNPLGLSNDVVFAITEDHEGYLWVGTEGGGLDRMDKDRKNFTHFKHDPNLQHSLGHNVIMYLLEDRHGDLWVGTRGGGLDRLGRDRRHFSHYRNDPGDPNSLSHNEIFTLYEDAKGTLWVGTWGGGLLKFNREKDNFTRYRHDPVNPYSIGDNTIFCIFDAPGDNGRHLWLGTNAGLNRLDHSTGRFTVFTTEDGLPNNVIYGILEDDKGYYWISCSNGISRFDPQKVTFKNYNERHGLQSNEFFSWSYRKTKDGEMYFGGINGFNAFYPGPIRENTHVPPVVITDFQVFNKSAPIGKTNEKEFFLERSIIESTQLTLDYRHRVFSFQFAALDFSAPEKNNYAYRMEGFDENWNEIGSRRFVTYTALPPGDYRFRVKASNNDGLWNDEGVSLKITITPPFWKQPLFILLAVLLGSLLVFALYRYRMRLLRIHTRMLESKVAERTADLTREIQGRKEVEEELKRAKDSAEAANSAKSEFVANMSHEIRTPMNAVIGLAELLLEKELPAEQRQYLQLVKSSADQLLNLLNDILDFSKIEAGQLELEFQPFDLRKAVEAVTDVMVHRVEEKGVELNLYVYPDVPIHLLGDPARLSQVLTNLLGNAIKFTQDGDISITVRLHEITEGEATLHFAVADTGIGIPKERQGAIFEIFTQADSSTTRQFGGTGLGLTIARQLVAMMDGDIWVESEVDKGSTFHFTAMFPLQEKLQPAAMLLPADIRGIHVLAVDDNATNRFVLTEMLHSFQCRPRVVEDAFTALQMLKADSTFKLLITDFQMPDMDGKQLVQRIRLNEKNPPLPIIILSSIKKNNELKELEKLGNLWILTKPVKQNLLYAAITSAVGASAPPEGAGKGAVPPEKVEIKDIIGQLAQLSNHTRILLAEDNVINQKVVQAIIRKTGIPMDVASNGKLALEKLDQESYDLVLMDVQMPEMDGITATRTIRRTPRFKELPVIAITAHAMKGDKERCFESGMNDYISKPIEARDLLNVLLEWLTFINNKAR